MKKVILKQISFLNFKGFKDFKITFNDDVTSVFGKNGTGKTTIFDGFTWLLFGKDSQDRKQFNLKTLDKNGKVIPKLPHEVSATIEDNGETIELCRRFNEKWVKRRGQVDEEFIGNEEERLFNKVPMSVKEWNEKISNICPEEIFKLITNPKHFVSQKTDVQRKMLFKMAGEISDSEIAKGNKDFTSLLESLSGKTMEEYKKEIQAKKKRIKSEIEFIPCRIDERKRDLAEIVEPDYDSIEASIQQKSEKKKKIEEEMLDAIKQNDSIRKEYDEMFQCLWKLNQEKNNLEKEIEDKLIAEYMEFTQKKSAIIFEITTQKDNVENLTKRKETLDKTLEDMKNYRYQLIEEWKRINDSEITFSENDFVCPTCHRPLDVDDIEKKKNEMIANFNLDKARRLEENNRKGQGLKRMMEDSIEKISSIDKEIKSAFDEIERLKSLDEYRMGMANPSESGLVRKTIDGDEEYILLLEEIAVNENKLKEMSNCKSVSFESQKEEISSLASEINDLMLKLSVRERANAIKERIIELENNYRKGAQELAELERIEFCMDQFSKAKTEAVEKRINGMFSFVKFKMYEQQINGGEVETCEATANGIPYSSQNNAMKINMGIDIINAICKYVGITAPIIVDNAESVNEIIPTQSQLIKLVVSDKEWSVL